MKTILASLFSRPLLLLLLSWVGLTAQVQAQPDLVISTPITCPNSVYAGGSYQLAATIRTQGTAAQFAFIGAYLSTNNAWDGTDVYLNSVGTNLFGSTTSATLPLNVTIPAATAAGSYYMVFVADPLDMERESNENNNVLAVPLSVLASGPTQLPDLALWRPSLSFYSLPPGGSLGAFTFVANYGAGNSPNVEVGYYLSADTVLAPGDVVLGTSAVGSLSASGGMSITSNPVLTVPASTNPGRYYILCVADHLNRIAESNEVNNSRALAITVTGTATAAASASSIAATQLYPNPVGRGQQLHLELGKQGQGHEVTVLVHNVLGQEMLRQQVDCLANGVATLGVDGLVPGQYVLHVLANGLLQGRQRLLVE